MPRRETPSVSRQHTNPDDADVRVLFHRTALSQELARELTLRWHDEYMDPCAIKRDHAEMTVSFEVPRTSTDDLPHWFSLLGLGIYRGYRRTDRVEVRGVSELVLPPHGASSLFEIYEVRDEVECLALDTDSGVMRLIGVAMTLSLASTRRPGVATRCVVLGPAPRRAGA